MLCVGFNRNGCLVRFPLEQLVAHEEFACLPTLVAEGDVGPPGPTAFPLKAGRGHR